MIRKLAKRLEDYQPKSSDEKLPQAAVLILCYEKEDDLFFIMTQRSNSLPSHPGEVAFPGGKKESFDDNLKITALRETHEEINLKNTDLEILGELPFFYTGTGIRQCRGRDEIHPLLPFLDQRHIGSEPVHCFT